MSEKQKRRLTVGDLIRSEKQTDVELQKEYGDKWQDVRTQAKEHHSGVARRKWQRSVLIVAPWAARLPKMSKSPKKSAVFSANNIVCMIEANGDGVDDSLYLEWGKMIAEAIREGRARDIDRLARYVEKLEDCRPGIKAPWPLNPEDLRGVKRTLSETQLKLIKALRDLLAEGVTKINRAALAKRAGITPKGKSYTKAFDIPELEGIPKAYTYTET